MAEITESFDNTPLTAGDPLLPSQDGVLPVEPLSNVMIKIVDDQGDMISFFPAHKTGSIVESGEAAGVEIPVSCQA